MIDEEDIQNVLKVILREGRVPCPVMLTDNQWDELLEDIWVELKHSENTSTRGEQEVGIPDQDSRLEEYYFTAWVSLDGEDKVLEVEGKILVSVDEHIGRDADDTYDVDWEVVDYEYEWFT